MQVHITVRLLQLDRVLFEVEKTAASPEMMLPPQEELVMYIPPPTTNVQTIELWYEQEAGEYSVPCTTF